MFRRSRRPAGPQVAPPGAVAAILNASAAALAAQQAQAAALEARRQRGSLLWRSRYGWAPIVVLVAVYGAGWLIRLFEVPALPVAGAGFLVGAVVFHRARQGRHFVHAMLCVLFLAGYLLAVSLGD